MVAEIPHGSVVITPTEMYTELRDVHDEIKRLATLMDPALRELHDDVAEGKREREKLSDRVRAVELRMWFAAGLAAAAGAGGGFGLAHVVGG